MSTLTQVSAPARPALMQRLEDLATPGEPSIALIAAPAGFGKTALVDAWVQQTTKPVARVRIGRAMALIECWTEFLETIALACEPEVADQVRALQLPDRGPRSRFVRDLLDIVGGAPMALVFEGLHHMTNLNLLAELDDLLPLLPHTWSVVLVSRQWTPLPSLHELSLNGGLARIDLQDLAMTREEVAERAHEVGLDPNRVWAQTEGWPAMVNLVIGLAPDTRLDAHLQREQGLVEYLFNESFGQRDPEVQEVLLAAAVGASAPGALVAEISGRGDAGAILHEQTASGLVTEKIARDENSSTFYLHPILRGYLRAEFMRRDADGFRRAHRLAAEFAAAHGDGLAAIRHSLAAGGEAVGQLVSTVGASLITTGRSEALLELLLPTLRTGGADAWTCTVTAAALADTGHFEECAAAMAAASKASTGQEVNSSDMRALQASVNSQLRRWRGTARRVSVPQVAEFAPDVGLLARVAFGGELMRAGAREEAVTLLSAALHQAQGLDRRPIIVEAQALLAGAACEAAQFGSAAARAGQGLRAAQEVHVLATSRTLGLLNAAGWSAYYQLDNAQAARMAQHAHDLLDHGHDPTSHALTRGLLSLVSHGEAPYDSAWFHEMWREAGTRIAPGTLARLAVLDAGRSFHAGRADRIKEVVESVRDLLGPSLESQVASAYLRISRGLNPQALAQLEPPLADDNVTAVDPLTRVEAYALVAWLAAHRGDPFHAVGHMRSALALADELSAPRAILAVGPVGLELLTQRRGSWGAQEPLVDAVLGYVQTPPTDTAVALTARELDVLRELPTLRTVEQIADDMVVSINTLKTHLRSIYRKLGVSARRDAVTEARRSGLL